MKTGFKTRSMLSMPIHDASGDVIGVAQAINKLSIVDEPFNEKDEKVGSRCSVPRCVCCCFRFAVLHKLHLGLVYSGHTSLLGITFSSGTFFFKESLLSCLRQFDFDCKNRAQEFLANAVTCYVYMCMRLGCDLCVTYNSFAWSLGPGTLGGG